MQLGAEETAALAGQSGEGMAMAMRLVTDAGRVLGAPDLVPIASAHIDGCLYHGDSGVVFAERLVALGARVAVPTTLNVGALDLLHPRRSRLAGQQRAMALRLMQAYEALGCRPTWTCAPYQAGHRPAVGSDVAWGESNAVAFCNSVLGARTNRYGDFLDIACAIAGRAPRYGLHLAANRRARFVVDTSAVSARLKAEDAFYPVLGALLGRRVGSGIAVVTGLAGAASEDRLKALGAAAASFGAVGLFHVAGVTPEAATLEIALGGQPAEETILVTPELIREARGWLSTTGRETIDAIAVGSPHLSQAECMAILDRLAGRAVALPFYLHTSRHVVSHLTSSGVLGRLEAAGITIVADTCIVVTPILPASTGVLMTNSGKFANYAPGNTGWAVVYASLAECVETAVAGRAVEHEEVWQ
jgi:hypothetical protein